MFEIRKISKGMMSAIILGVVIAFFISIIPNLQGFDIDQSLSVISPNKQINLKDENLVDYVVPFSNNMEIIKVTWEQNFLSIDYKIKQDNNIDTLIIYEEFFNLIKKSFVDTNNVDDVLLRVFLDDDNMFVAISASKEDIAKNPNMELISTNNQKDFLEQYFGLNYGNILKQD